MGSDRAGPCGSDPINRRATFGRVIAWRCARGQTRSVSDSIIHGAFNLFGDSRRDWLDPKMKGGWGLRGYHNQTPAGLTDKPDASIPLANRLAGRVRAAQRSPFRTSVPSTHPLEVGDGDAETAPVCTDDPEDARPKRPSKKPPRPIPEAALRASDGSADAAAA
jgi:hypothetical protein